MSINYSRFVEKNIRTVWVKNWAGDFLKELEKQKSQPAIEQYCKEKLQEFSNLCKEKADERAKTENRVADNADSWKQSSTSYLSGIRKAIKAWSDTQQLTEETAYPQQTKEGVVTQHLALLYMKYPNDHNQVNNEAKQERKDEQRRNLESINCIDQYQNTIERMLNSTDHRVLAAGLIAATGRRPSEIYKNGKFQQISQFELLFSGQSKTRGEERAPYPTYTLVESAKVIDGLARLRRMPEIKTLQRKTLAEIDSGKNSRMNDKVKEYFSALINPPHGELELSAKNLRASYAAIAIYLFCPKNVSTNLFIKERLGHTGDATATNYEDYQVCDPQGNPLPRGVWVTRLAEKLTKPMEATIVQPRIRMSEAVKNMIDNQEFLPFADQVSRMDELIRLAQIGKQFEEGKLVKEVVTVIEKPVEVVVEKVIEKVVEKVVQVPVETSIETQMGTPTETKIEAPKEKHPLIKVNQVKPKKVLAEIPNSALFGSHAPNTGEEKIRRAVTAIKAYNERQYSPRDMWMINTTTLKELTNCRTSVVDKYLKSDEGRLQVTDYNLEKGFKYQHNKGKGKISDFVKLG